jgi:hypothetical protein
MAVILAGSNGKSITRWRHTADARAAMQIR